jgi:hypothetical protein
MGVGPATALASLVKKQQTQPEQTKAPQNNPEAAAKSSDPADFLRKLDEKRLEADRLLFGPIQPTLF